MDHDDLRRKGKASDEKGEVQGQLSLAGNYG